jgi:hypothetical protein
MVFDWLIVGVLGVVIIVAGALLLIDLRFL